MGKKEAQQVKNKKLGEFFSKEYTKREDSPEFFEELLFERVKDATIKKTQKPILRLKH